MGWNVVMPTYHADRSWLMIVYYRNWSCSTWCRMYRVLECKTPGSSRTLLLLLLLWLL